MSTLQATSIQKNRLAKMLFSFIGVLLILLILFFCVLNFYVNSDAIKAQAVKIIAENTGRSLIIDGDISISLFPQVSLKAGPVRISNPPGFSSEEFASLQNITASLDLKALLSKNICITALYIDGLSVLLQKNKDNSCNWNFQTPSLKTSPEESKNSTQATTAKQKEPIFPKFLSTINLDAVHITNAHIQFHDLSTGTSINAQKLNLEIHDFSLNQQARISLSTDLSIPNKKISIPICCTSSFLLTTNNTLEITSLSGNIGPTLFTGTAKGNFGLPCKIYAKLDLDDLNLNTYLSLIENNKIESRADFSGNAASSEQPSPIKTPNLTSADLMPESTGKTNSNELSLLKNFLAQYTVKLDLQIRSLTVNTIKAGNIKAQIEGQDGTIRVKPFDCLIFKGTLGGEASLDVKEEQLRGILNATLLGADINECAQIFSKKPEITGTLDATANLSTLGITRQEIERSISGTVRAAARNGVIHALRLLPQAKLDGGYRNCSFSAVGNAGRFSSSDLRLEANGVNAIGHGWVDLPSKKTDMMLKVTVSDVSILPIRIFGNFDAPSIQMDAATTITSTILNIGTKIQEQKSQKDSTVSEQNQKKINDHPMGKFLFQFLK